MVEPCADVYVAIADPTRRRILRLLFDNEMSVTDLAEGFPVTRPAISQHLGVLRESGLVSYRKEGRTRFYRARPEPLAEVIDWLSYFDAFWTEKLAGLGRYLSEER
ncbi:MAG TPA: metalloregulator ArsR/SmtB family transcription factor [Thermoanaerobaculia bacterium]|nr:metalloregulator ArsR/SmtB family transcription factor [Thermoanaerobaculia bacterium]